MQTTTTDSVIRTGRMGLIDRLFGRSDDEEEPTYECSLCGETYDASRVVCENCGTSNVVSLR